MEYHQEPKEIFLPLSHEQYCMFYDLEMNHFHDDVDFYLETIEKTGKILELGCGSGRITRCLAEQGYDTSGIDISSRMLASAKRHEQSNKRYACMDMCKLGFQCSFSTILIPYNTLNLLPDLSAIKSCLNEVKNALTADGKLFLQLHIADKRLIKLDGKKIFQFQMFDLEDGGRLIKETLKWFDRSRQQLTMEERFRVRPATTEKAKEDLSHRYSFVSYSPDKWQQLIEESGFRIQNLFGDYHKSSFNSSKDSIMLLIAKQS